MYIHTTPHLFQTFRLGVVLCVLALLVLRSPRAEGYFSSHSSNSVVLTTGDWVLPEVQFQLRTNEKIVNLQDQVQQLNSEWGTSHEIHLRPLSAIEVQSITEENVSSNGLIKRWMNLKIDLKRTDPEYVEPTLRIANSHGIILERAIPNEYEQTAEFIFPVLYTLEELQHEQGLAVQIVSDFLVDPGLSGSILSATTQAVALNSSISELFVLALDASTTTVRCWKENAEELSVLRSEDSVFQLLQLPLGRFQLSCAAVDQLGQQSAVASLVVENAVELGTRAPSVTLVGENDGEWLVSHANENLNDPWYSYAYRYFPAEENEIVLSPLQFLPRVHFDTLNTVAQSNTDPFKYVVSEESLALIFPHAVAGGKFVTQTTDAAGNVVESESLVSEQGHDLLHSISISELMWMGSPLSTTDEWIELRNSSAENVDISGWKITGLGAAGSAITIPSNTFISSFGYLVIARYQPGGIDTLLRPVSQWLTGALSLANSNETLELLTADGIVIDRVVFAQWPAGSNQLPKRSMQRQAFLSNGSDAQSWYTCESLECESVQALLWTQSGVFGTPGQPNR